MKHLPIYCHQSGFWARFGSPCGSGFKFQMYVKHLRSKELRVDLDRDKAVFILQSVYGSVFFFTVPPIALLKEEKHCGSRWKVGVAVMSPVYPGALSVTPEQAQSFTCFRAFPVCCNQDYGIICPAPKAGSQSGERNGSKSGAAAGDPHEELFQSRSGVKLKKKENPHFSQQLQFTSAGRSASTKNKHRRTVSVCSKDQEPRKKTQTTRTEKKSFCQFLYPIVSSDPRMNHVRSHFSKKK